MESAPPVTVVSPPVIVTASISVPVITTVVPPVPAQHGDSETPMCTCSIEKHAVYKPISYNGPATTTFRQQSLSGLPGVQRAASLHTASFCMVMLLLLLPLLPLINSCSPVPVSIISPTVPVITAVPASNKLCDQVWLDTNERSEPKVN
jgi:hypothetical protein